LLIVFLAICNSSKLSLYNISKLDTPIFIGVNSKISLQLLTKRHNHYLINIQ